MTLKISDLTFDSGFMYCRMAGVDESSGVEVAVPGVHARFRCDTVNACVQADEDTVLIYMNGHKDPFEIFATLGAVDKIMRRANLVEVGAPQETPEVPTPTTSGPTTAPDRA